MGLLLQYIALVSGIDLALEKWFSYAHTYLIEDAVIEHISQRDDEADIHDSDYEDSEDEEIKVVEEPKKKKARQTCKCIMCSYHVFISYVHII